MPGERAKKRWPRGGAALAVVMLAGLATLGGTPSAAATANAPSAAPAGTLASSPPKWSWPVDVPRSILRSYAGPATAYSAGHRGIDLAAAVGSAVHSPADGVVSFAGTVVDRPVLSLRHADGLVSSFEPVTAEVADGAVVAEGQVVGTVAESSGHCPSGCLHFGVRRSGEYLSPLMLLGGVPRAILLPLESDPQARG